MSTMTGTDRTTARSGRVGDAKPWVGLLARLVLGGVLLVAGLLKVTKPLASARAAQAYQILPFDLAGYVGMALPVIEIVVGLLLIAGLFTRTAGIVGTVLTVIFIVAIASVWARGINIDCGCFGNGGAVAEKPNYGLHILGDAALALCGLWVARFPRTAVSADGAMSKERKFA